MKKSKLGFGLLANHDPADRDAIFTVQPRGTLLLQEHRNHLRRAASSCEYPAVRTFYRSANFKPDFSAQKWFEHARDNLPLGDAVFIAQQRGKKLWVQGPNEVEITEAYGRFEAERVHLLAGIGARAIVCNAGVGRPTAENIAAFYRGFNAVMAEKGEAPYAFGVHEYGYIWPWVWMGAHQGETPFHKYTQFPDPPKPGEPAHLIGRFQHLGVPDDVPIFITECGLDVVTSDKWTLPKRKDGEPYGGWKTCQGYWKKQHANGKEKLFYGDLLVWIDAYYRQFEQVKAVYLFGVGPHHDGEFADFDLAGPVLDYTLAYIKGEGDMSEPEPVPEPNPPTPDPAPNNAYQKAHLAKLEAEAAALELQIDSLKLQLQAALTFIKFLKESIKED